MDSVCSPTSTRWVTSSGRGTRVAHSHTNGRTRLPLLARPLSRLRERGGACLSRLGGPVRSVVCPMWAWTDRSRRAWSVIFGLGVCASGRGRLRGRGGGDWGTGDRIGRSQEFERRELGQGVCLSSTRDCLFFGYLCVCL